MRIFLAGATGVIGRRVVPLLAGRGHSVTGLVRRPSDAEWLRGLGAEAALADVYDADGLRRAVGLAAPDVVMHQLTDLKGGNLGANSEMRTTGTRYLMDAALAAGIRRVVAQSIAWAYQAGKGPATEDVPLDLGASGSRRRTVQGVAALEAAVREAPEWVVLRYGVLYGPGTWYSRGGLMAQRASRGELAADGDVSSFVHVDDAAGAAAYGRYAGRRRRRTWSGCSSSMTMTGCWSAGIAGRSADDEDRLARTAGPSAAFEGLSPFGQREGLADHPSQPSGVGHLRQLG
jgi:nucleoside-diphosphate-sugar epimerase